MQASCNIEESEEGQRQREYEQREDAQQYRNETGSADVGFYQQIQRNGAEAGEIQVPADAEGLAEGLRQGIPGLSEGEKVQKEKSEAQEAAPFWREEFSHRLR